MSDLAGDRDHHTDDQRHMMARAFVWIAAAIFVVAGLSYLISPASLTQATGVSADASGLTDIRANYGGFQLGVGVFLVWCARARVSMVFFSRRWCWAPCC